MPDRRGFFDTNILVYSISEGHEFAPRAKALRDYGGVVSVQVLNELVSVLKRKIQTPWPLTREILDLVKSLVTVTPLTLETHERGVRLAERYGFAIYDAMIVAAALEAECTTLYSEDMQHGMVIGTLRIENPFI